MTRARIAMIATAVALALSGCAGGSDGLRQATGATQAFAPLRSKVATAIGENRYPGAVFAIARGDTVLEVEALGVAHVDTGVPMRRDSIFRLMSMTKPVTAVAAMMLVEQGKLDLDAPVAQVLPEFADFGVAGAPPLSLRHLLTHSSGIGFGSITGEATTLAARARMTAARAMRVPAGKEWAYSGVEGPDVAARMIEVVAGEPYAQFVQRRIFDPLGMKDTGYTLTAEQQKRLVGLHAAQGGNVAVSAPPLPDIRYSSGGAGLYSTAPDYLRLAQMLAGNGALGKIRILTPRSVEEIRRAQLQAGFPGLTPGMGHGLLVRHIVDPAAARSPLPAGAYGWSGAYGTHFWVDPASGLAAVWMINLSNAGGANSPDALAFEKMVMDACTPMRACAPR